jgi:hypothetical protein
MTISFTPEQLERIELWEQELLNPDRNQEIAAAIQYTYLEGGYEEDPDPVEAVNFDTQTQA